MFKMLKETVVEWFGMTVFLAVMFLIFVLDLAYNGTNKMDRDEEF